MNNKKALYAIIGIILIAIIVIVGFLIIKNNNTKDSDKTNNDNKASKEQNIEVNGNKEKNDENEEENEVDKNPIVTMKIKNFGTVKIELYPNEAPITVANFVSLVQEGYYDGLIFHRIIPGFMAQGGDKAGTGSGDTEYTIKGEFSKNGVKNNIKHEKGVISMARADYTYYGKTEEGYNSAFSQFFIMFEDTTSLNGLYAAFGKVIEGMDVIDKLANIEISVNSQTGERSVPVDPPVIEKMTVDTFGVEYKPERMKAFDIMAYINGLQ